MQGHFIGFLVTKQGVFLQIFVPTQGHLNRTAAGRPSVVSGTRALICSFLADPLKISMEGSDELRRIWSRLSELSGFPEPHLADRLTTYRRWSTTYSHQLIREDIRDLTGIKNVLS